MTLDGSPFINYFLGRINRIFRITEHWQLSEKKEKEKEKFTKVRSEVKLRQSGDRLMSSIREQHVIDRRPG